MCGHGAHSIDENQRKRQFYQAKIKMQGKSGIILKNVKSILSKKLIIF
jgi:hypothetical protein